MTEILTLAGVLVIAYIALQFISELFLSLGATTIQDRRNLDRIDVLISELKGIKTVLNELAEAMKDKK